MTDYGHHPFGGMVVCLECGQKSRTVERAREHEGSPECLERRIEQGKQMGGAS